MLYQSFFVESLAPSDCSSSLSWLDGSRVAWIQVCLERLERDGLVMRCWAHYILASQSLLALPAANNGSTERYTTFRYLLINPPFR
ncbi:hypothetical protein SISSUDRAFT_527031 [Sistotremastrum suecicum HHB10207 ss-3]|uniref:Uncharacterized protein n=1 Tax=Sistotremastrum suecicum HHB10207 ss-3 TaxID=1314776 RepID=A0A165XVN8_9AGAM|nr:hypothetical protein SISSUDRAFT_527031 [Sistotremastrum suecicum HHB10207 ss-3]